MLHTIKAQASMALCSAALLTARYEIHVSGGLLLSRVWIV